MGMGFVPTWLRQVSPPLLHKTTLTTGCRLPNCTWIGATSRPCWAKKLIFSIWQNWTQAVCRFVEYPAGNEW